MTIHFFLDFRTTYGQNLYISGSLPELGSGDPEKAVPMHFTEGFIWEKILKITSLQERIMSYRYLVKSDDGSDFYEVGPERAIGLNSATKDLFLHDEWQGNSESAPFLTSPFSEIFYSHEHKEATQTHILSKELIIRVTVPLVEPEWNLALCGDSPLTGAWDPLKAPEMIPVHGSRWVIHLPADKIGNRLEYKFIKRHKTDNTTIWEERENRILEIPQIKSHQTLSLEHSSAAFHTGTPRFYGTAVPVFSLRTAGSCGIGDFSDLKLFGDWIKKAGQNIIQILPVNDTTATGTWTDSYPYESISVMALHPIYINITGIGPIADAEADAAYENRRRRLENMPAVDYEEVLKLKTEYLRLQFKTYSQDTFAEPKFLSFYKKNKEWLLPYCAFCTLRDKFGTADFHKWGEDAKYNSGLPARLNSKESGTYREMSFHLFVQYHLHRQLADAVHYLHSIGIALKGDIPIGIGRNSADAWASPELFNMDSQTGAPPDDFSATGQNWGFPTYNWDRMAETDYRWWRKRLSKMAEYFDAYRIDHILGFFRIWEIPYTQTNGLLGHFFPALPLSYEEIRDMGFNFVYGKHARPNIAYCHLKELFGDRTENVICGYLDSTADDTFTLKPDFDTQKKIEGRFGPGPDSIKDGLMTLAGEILFMEDPRQPGKFHPRISAQQTYAYKDLSEGQKSVYDNIYNNFFYKRHNMLWRESALRKLPALISASNMLACAEDLGMIPECVPGVIHDLRILSLEIFRMPKNPAVPFGDPSRYPYMSVCTTGTHDTSTLRAWWEEDRAASTKYWHEMLHETGNPPYFCEPWLCEKIIRLHTGGSSMLTILPLQDWLSVDGETRAEKPDSERINIPSDPRHYWRYRMHIPVESLIGNDKLTARLKSLTGR